MILFVFNTNLKSVLCPFKDSQKEFSHCSFVMQLKKGYLNFSFIKYNTVIIYYFK